MVKLLKCCRAEVLVRRFVRSGKYRARCAKCNAELTKATREKLNAAWNKAVEKQKAEKRDADLRVPMPERTMRDADGEAVPTG